MKRPYLLGYHFAWISATTALFTILVTGCPATVEKAQKPPTSLQNKSEFLVVDCLLPGQVRKAQANFTYLTPRRVIRTTLADCRNRGGQYITETQADTTPEQKTSDER